MQNDNAVYGENMKAKRVFLIVLDSVGIGELPDAYLYGDEGSNTLRSCYKQENFSIPELERSGLYNIDGIDYADGVSSPDGAYGRFVEASKGKDTTTGHWEIAGVISEKPFPVYPDGFPKDVLDKFPGITIVCSTSDYVSTVAKPVFKAFEKIKVKAEITNQKKISYNTVTHLSFITKAVQNNGEETAVYLHGGGTTGKSKTICLSSNNLNALAFKLSFLDSPHRPGEEFSLAVLPLFHAFGLGVVVHFSMCAGFTVIGMPQFSPEKANKYLKKYKYFFN